MSNYDDFELDIQCAHVGEHEEEKITYTATGCATQRPRSCNGCPQ